MSEKVSIRVSSALAFFAKPDTPPEEKLKFISGSVTASLHDRVTLLFFLCYDKNPEVKAAAVAQMKLLPFPLVEELYLSPETHQRLKELLARLHPLVACQSMDPGAEEPVEVLHSADRESQSEDVKGEAEEGEGAEEEEEYRSKYQLAQAMGVGEKIKMALTGDKEWRSILIKDSNKLVNGAVVKNPRITEPEILAISKSVIQNDEILRVICNNKEWVKNYEIRKALVLNNKTPLPVALRFMGFLSEKDLGAMSKSKNISSVICNQARRMLSNKKKS